ncbi:MAG: glucose dehydrogenase, partial [Pyrinomonadaceae bacterium]
FGSVNAGLEHFAEGVRDMTECQSLYSDWLAKMLTNPVQGIDNFRQMFDLLNNGAPGMVKTFCQIFE